MTKFGMSGGSWSDVDLATYPSLTANTTVRGGEGAALPDFAPRVRVGMDVLDEAAPGWQRRIDWSTLDLENTTSCVLGQTWPYYSRLVGAAETVPDSYLFEHASGDMQPVTNFAQMALHLVSTARNGQSSTSYAAAMGCALSASDADLINVRAKFLIHKKMPFGAESVEGLIATTSLARKLADEMFHELTDTWVREFETAQRMGRWPQDHLILPSRQLTMMSPPRDLVTV